MSMMENLTEKYLAELMENRERELKQVEILTHEITELQRQIELKKAEIEERRRAAAVLERMLAAVKQPVGPAASAAPAAQAAAAEPAAVAEKIETAESAAPAAEPAAIPLEPLPPRRRGRPPKEEVKSAAAGVQTEAPRRRGRPPKPREVEAETITAPPELVEKVNAVQLNTTPPDVTPDMPALYTVMIHETIKAHFLGLSRISSPDLAARISADGRFGVISGRKFTPHAGKIPHLAFEKIDNQGHWKYTHEEYKQQCFAVIREVIGE